MILIVMGVSGCGKSTVGALLAQTLAAEFLDADEFHPPENVAKMAAGVPLTDADRRPWLERLNGELKKRTDAVLACSALKASYRRTLAQAIDCRFVHLRGPIELIRARLQARRHRYMPASLLESQFAALEAPQDAIEVDIAATPRACVDAIIAAMAQIGLTPNRLSTAHTSAEPTNTFAAKRHAMAPWCGKLGPVAIRPVPDIKEFVFERLVESEALVGSVLAADRAARKGRA